MNAMAVIAAAPARTPNVSPDAAASDGEGERGFAAALDLAREPAKTAAEGAAKDQGKPGTKGAAAPAAKSASRAEARTQEKPVPAGDVSAQDTAASVAQLKGIDATAVDATLLLPGWPATVALTPQAATAAATPAEAPVDGDAWFNDIAPVLVGKRATTPAADALQAERSLPATAMPAVPTAPAAAALGDRVPAAALDARVQAAAPAGAPAAAVDAALAAVAKPGADSAPTITPTSPTLMLPNAQAAAPAAPVAASAAAPVFAARLSAALDSPAFAPALATQVTWLAQEGQQLARLTLNPAEMGPVTVRIVIDGTQARIDFHAAMAGTRAAIEASLPTLAAALHDSGLTLAGGGVSDGQARQGAQGDRSTQAQGPAQAAAATARLTENSLTRPLRAARGLVDLVA